MDVHGIVPTHIRLELANRFQKGQAFNITNRPTNLDNYHISWLSSATSLIGL